MKIKWPWAKKQSQVVSSVEPVMVGVSKPAVSPAGYNFSYGGKSAMNIYVPALGKWYIKNIDGQTIADGTQWGGSNMVQVYGDFDGDGFDDLAVWDTVTGKWYIHSIKNNDSLAWDLQFGMKGGIPLGGDYDGDGTDDLAIFDPATGNWYIRDLQNKVIAYGYNWGSSCSIPIEGDFDGDGVADLAVYNPDGNWYIRSLAKQQTLAWGVNLGVSNGVPISGDFDGDGKSEIGVFDSVNAKWYIQGLDGHKVLWGFQWGWPGAFIGVGDFDGDGADEIVAFENKEYGKWYVYSPKKQAVVAYGSDCGCPISNLTWSTEPSQMVGYGVDDSWMWQDANILGDAMATSGLNITSIDMFGCDRTSKPENKAGYWYDHFDQLQPYLTTFLDAMKKRKILVSVSLMGWNFPNMCAAQYDVTWFNRIMDYFVARGSEGLILETASEPGVRNTQCMNKFYQFSAIVDQRWTGMKDWNLGSRPQTAPVGYFIKYHPASTSDYGPANCIILTDGPAGGQISKGTDPTKPIYFYPPKGSPFVNALFKQRKAFIYYGWGFDGSFIDFEGIKAIAAAFK